MVGRRAAVGGGIYGHTHVATWLNGIFNSGHATLGFDYAKGWYEQGFKAITIKTPLSTQVLLFMDGTFFGSSTHGDPNFEFRPGYPNLKPLPVNSKTLPAVASDINQWGTGSANEHVKKAN